MAQLLKDNGGECTKDQAGAASDSYTICTIF